MKVHVLSNTREGLDLLPGGTALLPGVYVPEARKDECACGAILSRYNKTNKCASCDSRER